MIDGMPGPVVSIDVSADGGMIAWTTPEFVFLTCPNAKNWQKGVKEPKPAVLKLSISATERAALEADLMARLTEVHESTEGFFAPDPETEPGAPETEFDSGVTSR